VAGSKRQRELARRRAERQAERRAAALRQKRQRLIVTSSGVGVLLIVLAVYFATRDGGNKKPDAEATPSASASATPSASVAPKAVACGAKAPAAIKPQTFPSAPPMKIDKTKTYVATVKTSCGTVVVDLLADKAPTTVNSFNFLAGKKYFDGTKCHRMLDEGDFVLQCGDPTGTGAGGPGYQFNSENLPKATTKGAPFTYPAGTLAMANSGDPSTNGSQFFFVVKDSPFQPDYTVFGKVTKGLDVLQKILKVGQDNTSSAGGGEPNQRVFIESFTVTPAT
jgi:peptidyl-prolyl cis-trans isomerase B (cyclophilin B)